MLPIALKNGKIIHIKDVPSGLACGCICPACQSPLVAKKGSRKVHHFTHYKHAECSGGLETTLHYYAKELLASHRNIVVPPLKIRQVETPILPARRLSFDKVVLEKAWNRTRPDLALRIAPYQWIHIELIVTHATEYSKLKQLQKSKIKALEVDLMAFQKTVDLAELRYVLLKGTGRKTWLNHPQKTELLHRIHSSSTSKKVKIRTNGKWHFYTVKQCPAQKRKWKERGIDGLYYAHVFQDCLHCKYCLGIDYYDKEDSLDFGPALPQSIQCAGNLDFHDFHQLQKSLKDVNCNF